MTKKFHYAWVILILCFLGILAAQGVRLAFGAFIQPWQRDFSLDRGTLSLISAVSFVIYGVSQPVYGRFIEKIGVRKIFSFSVFIIGICIFLTRFVSSPFELFILYGVFASIGFGGASGVAASVAVTTWFQKKRGLAFGIIETAFGAGQMIMVPASLYMINWAGWRWTAVILGLFLMLIVCPILLLFLRSNPSAYGVRPFGNKERLVATIEEDVAKTIEPVRSRFAIFRMRAFWCLVIPFFICGFTTTGLMDTHLVPFCYDQGYSITTTSLAVGVLAASNMVGSLFSGQIADMFNNRVFLGCLYLARLLSILILIVTTQVQWLFVFSILFGLVDFATSVPTQLLAADYFKNYSVGLVLGFLSMSHQIGSALGAYLPGLIYSVHGSYHTSFIVAVFLLFIATSLTLSFPNPTKKTTSTILE